ncbi:hypothetical protein HYG86_13020 [Alkalicella caledoniensis]|uniref:Uncharacterized protein n=1 Tax=Alkalicella caledoniensis TaxID=2731377 RepID=A0A7G9WAB8_ALKCA|nr:hypothetical protein [Alkalicella caledoniensis]QNO15630.1 hypothetical protein HYG86_13020 [Alkalicella caledoniensis]
MDFICPVCNGLENIYIDCPKCRESMEEGGSLQQFLDSYSPYISGDILDEEGMNEKQCVHLVFCGECGYDERVSVKKVNW